MVKRRRFATPPRIALQVPLALIAVALSPQSRAQIQVQPAVEVRETYSDNVRLEPEETARGQFISEITPSLSVRSDTRRLKLTSNLSARLYGYSGERLPGNARRSIQGSLVGRATAIDDLLYVDANASRSRQAISAFGQQFQNDYNNANQDDVTTYRISPFLVRRYPLGNLEVRYTHDQVRSTQNLLSNSSGDSAQLRLSSGSAYNKFGYDLSLYHQDLEDRYAGKSTTDNANGTLRYRLQQMLSIYSTVGYDRYDYEGIGGTTQGKSYSGGFTWTPSLRTTVDASIGRRYFGKTYSLDLSQRSQHTVMRASYRDEVTTSRAQFLQPGSINTSTLLDASFAAAFPDPVERLQAIQAYINATGLPLTVPNNVNYFSNRLMLQRSFQASVAINGARSTAIVSFSNTKRNALSPAGADGNLVAVAAPNLNDDVRQRMLSAALSYRVSSRSSATLQASSSRSESPDMSLGQSQTVVSFNLSRQIDRKLLGNLELRHNMGHTLGLNARPYKENAISASLSYKL